jgi:large subunit ribosomal protein L9
MKVILLQDVAKIGRRSELVEVPDGYALNQLIPKRMAEPATAANKKRLEKRQAESAAHQAADEQRFTAAATALTAEPLTVVGDANDQGSLFKAVNAKDIAAAAQAKGVDVPEAMIVVGSPIKEIGEHTVRLVRGDQEATFTVEVIKNAS